MKAITENSKLVDLKSKYCFEFQLEQYSNDRGLLFYEGEDQDNDQLYYVVMAGCKRVSNKMQRFTFQDISIQKDNGLVNILFKKECAGIKCKALEIWTEDEYDEFQDEVVEIEDSRIVAVLDKSA